MLIINPELFFLIIGIHSLMIVIGPNKFVWKALLISVSLVSSNGPVIPIPALLIKTSIIPSFLTMYLIQFLISTALSMSHLINSKSLILYFFGFLQIIIDSYKCFI